MRALGWGGIAAVRTGGGGAGVRAARLDRRAGQAQSPSLFTTVGITTEQTRANGGIRGGWTLPAEEMPASRTVAVPGRHARRRPAADARHDRQPAQLRRLPGPAAHAARRGPRQLHADPLLRHDRGRRGRRRLPADLRRRLDPDRRGVVPGLVPGRPPGDRPAEQALDAHREDGAPCSIFHVPAEIDEAKELVSVKLPPGTVGGPPEVAYLMALTLERASGDSLFRMPDLSGREPCAAETVPPVTTHGFDPAAPNGGAGWYAGAVGISLAATDEAGGSGVEQVLFRVDGGPVRPYSGEIDFADDGAHTLEYRAIDCAGNAEAFKSVDFKVDAHAPSTEARLSPGNAVRAGRLVRRRGRRLARGARRPGLGHRGERVPARRRELDRVHGRDQRRPGRLHVVGFRSTDVAGNVETERSLPIRIDATPPQTSALINGAAPAGLRRRRAGRARAQRRRGLRRRRLGVPPRRRGVDALRRRVRRPRTRRAPRGLPLARRGGQHGAVPHPQVHPDRAAASSDRAARRSPRSPRRAAARPRPARSGAAGWSCGSPARASIAAPCALRVDRATARRLGLGSRVLAERAVRCGDQGRASVRLRPGRAVRRALARSRTGVAARLTLRLGQATDSDLDLPAAW